MRSQFKHRGALCKPDHSKPKGYPTMSSKQPAVAAKKAVPHPAAQPTPAVKKARKPKTPGMSIKMKFDVMTAINGADAKTPDATVAASLTAAHGRAISAQQVGKYRKELGLASVGKPKPADLLADLAAAQARIAALEAGLEAGLSLALGAVSATAPATEPAAA